MQFYHDNPFYDFVFVSVGETIPSVTGFKKLIGRILLQHQDSKRIHEFRRVLRDCLHDYPEFKMPFDGRILISLAIGLEKKEFPCRDIDNMAKSLLDALKGVVYKDDKQVDVLHVIKYQADDDRWNIGIKQLDSSDSLWHFPWLYKESPFGLTKISPRK